MHYPAGGHMSVRTSRVSFAAVLVGSLLGARSASAEPGGNIDLDVFRPAIDSRGYLTINASQVLGNNEFSFGLGSLDWGHHLLAFQGANDQTFYKVNDVISAT